LTASLSGTTGRSSTRADHPTGLPTRRTSAHAAGPGPSRYPLADYTSRRLPGHFDLLVVDEPQEYKARGSAQGIAAGTLAESCGRTLTLTGTLACGYASTLFHLLWRFSPAVREEFAYGEEGRWVSRSGLVERITKRGDDGAYEDGRTSRRRGYRTRTVEKPGGSPAVLFHLSGTPSSCGSRTSRRDSRSTGRRCV
jgi:hypothetical protein